MIVSIDYYDLLPLGTCVRVRNEYGRVVIAAMEPAPPPQCQIAVHYIQFTHQRIKHGEAYSTIALHGEQPRRVEYKNIVVVPARHFDLVCTNA